MKAVSNHTSIIKETEKAILILLPFTQFEDGDTDDSVRYFETWVPKSCIIEQIAHVSNPSFSFVIQAGCVKPRFSEMQGIHSAGEWFPIVFFYNASAEIQVF